MPRDGHVGIHVSTREAGAARTEFASDDHGERPEAAIRFKVSPVSFCRISTIIRRLFVDACDVLEKTFLFPLRVSGTGIQNFPSGLFSFRFGLGRLNLYLLPPPPLLFTSHHD